VSQPLQAPPPYGMRVFAMVAAAIGALVSWGAARDVALALSMPGRDLPEVDLRAWKPFLADPAQEEALKAAVRASMQAQASVIESMQTSRVAILIILSGAATMVFVTALRLRWPGGIPRPGVAKFLGGAAFTAAVLRTLDGAQELVIVQRAAAATERALAVASTTTERPVPEGFATAFSFVWSVGFTAAVVIAFTLFGAYFRSQKTNDVLSKLDRHLEDE
jgi:hypothetical protein